MARQLARDLLDQLVDLHERNPGRVRPPFRKVPRSDRSGRPLLSEDIKDLHDTLKAVESLGAIKIYMGKGELAHLPEKIRLVDINKLRGFLGRAAISKKVGSAIQGLRKMPERDALEALGLIERFEYAWNRGVSAFGMKLEDTNAAENFLRAICIVLEGNPNGDDMRTLSRRGLGDSKSLERSAGSLASCLREIGLVPAGLTPMEALDHLGIKKLRPPVLIAGPISVAGVNTGELPFVGLPAESFADIALTSPINSVLTIENMSSFQRHVAEAKRQDEVVLYTGGFPSTPVQSGLKRILELAPNAVTFHWGDIDPHGLWIAETIRSIAGTTFRPHLMSIEIARKHGAPSPGYPKLSEYPESSPLKPLATFLASPDAAVLEQEEIEPEQIK